MEAQHHPYPAPLHDHDAPGPGGISVTGPARAERVEQAGAPDALRAAALVRNRTGTPTPVTGTARGVEWVRATDLLARHSATWSGRGIDFQAELARRTRAPLARASGRVGARARRLPPLTAFGRGSPTAPGPVRSGVGMS